MTRVRVAVCASLAVHAIGVAAQAPYEQRTFLPFRPEHVETWVNAVETHEPGSADEPLVRVRALSLAELERVLIDLNSISALIRDPRASVERRLRGLLLKRAGSRLTAGRAAAWTRPFFEPLGLLRLRGTIRYPGAAHATT
jgi:hypothetical protein